MLLLDADDEEDDEEHDGPSRPAEAAVASSRLADRFTLTADFVVLLQCCCCSLLLVLLELDGLPLLYGCLLLVGVDASD